MNRKKALIIQLVLWIVILFATIWFFLFMLNTSPFNSSLYSSSFGINHKNYTTKTYESNVALEDKYEEFSNINKIEIDAIAHNVTIAEHSESFVSIEEINYGSSGINSTIEQDGSTLKYTSAKANIINFNFSSFGGEINILVPKGSAYTYNIDAVSGDVTVFANSSELDINTVSGSIDVSMEGDEFDAKTVSGKIYVNAPFNTVDAKTTSGSIEVTSGYNSKSIEAESISGRIKIYKPADLGYIFKYRTVSGNVKDEHSNNSFSDKNGKYQGGNGQLNIEAQTTSGSITLAE